VTPLNWVQISEIGLKIPQSDSVTRRWLLRPMIETAFAQRKPTNCILPSTWPFPLDFIGESDFSRSY